MNTPNHNTGRRRFLKGLGLGSLTLAATAAGCRRAVDSVAGSSTSAKDVPTDGMTMRTNPSTGDRVSLLGYGMMRLPQIPDSEELDQEEINRLVDYALAHGVNYFDTAPVYCRGNSESATGIALSRHPRDSYYVATKLSNFSPSSWSREEGIKIFENSLQYLRTDYVDYLLMHAVGGGGIDNLNKRFIDNGLLDYLKEQRREGRIRNLGFSFHGDVEVYDHLLAMHDRGEAHWDFVQIQHNYVDWHSKEGNARRSEYLLGELTKRNIPAVIMEPLLGGALASLPDHLTASLKERRPDDSVASWAFRFAGTDPGILTVLSGMTCMDHLQDNITTYSPLTPCDDSEMELLDRTATLLAEYPTVPCTGCQYCMPCPYGLDIPSIFAHYNKCVNEGNVTVDPDDNDYRRARKAFLVGYDRKVPRLRQASHCIGCNECTSHCPQNIKIPHEMRRIDRYVEQLKQS